MFLDSIHFFFFKIDSKRLLVDICVRVDKTEFFFCFEVHQIRIVYVINPNVAVKDSM